MLDDDDDEDEEEEMNCHARPTCSLKVQKVLCRPSGSYLVFFFILDVLIMSSAQVGRGERDLGCWSMRGEMVAQPC